MAYATSPDATLRRAAAAFVLLAAVLLAAYWPALHGAMLWDDDAHLTPPALASANGLWRLWTEPKLSQQYYPVVGTAFWLMNALWGHATLGYHVVNVMLHALSAVLVAGLLRRWSVPGAWFAAILFALHPVHVETVAWMSELKNALSGVCFLMALRSWCTFDHARRRGAWAVSLLWFVLALGSKSVTATMPAAALVVVWWRRGRIDLRRDVVPLLPFFAAGVLAGLGTAWFEYHLVGARGGDFALGPLDRVLLASRALTFYAAKLVWPHPLVFSYPRWTIDAGVWWQWTFLLGVLLALAAAFRARSRTRAPLAALLFFAGTLGPALGFVNVYPFRFSYVADHFQYLASLGLLSLAGALLARVRLPFVVVAVVVGAPLATLTFVQSRQYVDAETQYRATIAANPTSTLAYSNLTKVLLDGPDSGWPEAAAAGQRAVDLAPRDANPRSNLGLALHRVGRDADAERELRRALELDPEWAPAHHNLGFVFAAQGRFAEAVAEYQKALVLDPENAMSWHHLGRALESMGHVPEAIVAEQRAVALQPEHEELWLDLGNALLGNGAFDDAIAAYQRAVTIKPGWGDALTNIAIAQSSAGRGDEALAAFAAADRAMPDSFLVLHNWAQQLAKMNRIEPAIATNERALAVVPAAMAADQHDQFGAWLLRLGHTDAAIAHFEAALRASPDFAAAKQHLEQARAK